MYKNIHAIVRKNLGLLKLITILGLIIALFAKPMEELFWVWRTDADYSHGYFVIPLTGYMIWRKRDVWQHIQSQFSWTGFAIFIICLFSYITTTIVSFHSLINVMMIASIMGLCLTILGWKKSKFFVGPICFLVFMIPIPSSIYILITNPLKLFITDVSASIIKLFDIPVFQIGNLLFFSNTQLEVAEACSGLRSIYSYLMLGFVFSILCNRKISKIILLVAAIPLALIVNIVRVTTTGILSHHFGEQMAQGFFHELAGMLLFFIGFVLMIAIYYIVDDFLITDSL